MKKRRIPIFLCLLGLCWAIAGAPAHAQKFPRALTLLYGNNINGEIEPCPT
jgi:hypothetical protein